MKKRASKTAGARPATKPDPTNCDGSPPYSSNPPPTGEIPGQGVLNSVFYGPKDVAAAFNRGQLVQHTMQLENEERSYVFSLRGGPHKRRTLSKIELRALAGPCTVVIQDGPTTILQSGDSMEIPAGSTFSFETSTKAVLLGRSLAGPGLGLSKDDRDLYSRVSHATAAARRAGDHPR